jgi:hypothetical protein
MSNANKPIDRPFRLIEKRECPDPNLLDALLFFQTGGVVEAVGYEEFDDFTWKVWTHSFDGHN